MPTNEYGQRTKSKTVPTAKVEKMSKTPKGNQRDFLQVFADERDV